MPQIDFQPEAPAIDFQPADTGTQKLTAPLKINQPVKNSAPVSEKPVAEAGKGYGAYKMLPDPGTPTAQSRWTKTPIFFGQTADVPEDQTGYSDFDRNIIQQNPGGESPASPLNQSVLRHESIHGLLRQAPIDYPKVVSDPSVKVLSDQVMKILRANGYHGESESEIPAYMAVFSNADTEWTKHVPVELRNHYIAAFSKALAKQDQATAQKYLRMSAGPRTGEGVDITAGPKTSYEPSAPTDASGRPTKMIGKKQTPTDIDKPLIDFRKLGAERYITGTGKPSQVARGVTRGVESAAAGLTTPKNVALLLGTWAIGGPEAGLAIKAVNRLISTGFGVDMLWNAAKQAPHLVDQIRHGDWEGASETLTGLGITAGMGGAALYHGVHPGTTGPQETLRTEASSERPAATGPAATAARQAISRIDEIAPKIDFQPEETTSTTQNAPSNEGAKAENAGTPEIRGDEAGTEQPLQFGFLGSQYLDKLWTENVAPALAEGATTAKKAGISLAEWMAPRAMAGKKGVDIAMRMKGAREEQLFKLEAIYSGVKKMFEKMPQAAQIDVMDRIKTGRPQATPELQELVDSWRVIEDRLFSQVQQFKPDAPYLENHFRVFWKTLPAPEGQLPIGRPGIRQIFSRSRRPLRGTQGFLKRHTLADVSEGIARGGEPVSYNPQTLFELSVNDMLKFITAQRMWEQAKLEGLLKFARGGSPQVPDGYVRLNDRISQKSTRVYFGQKIGPNLVETTGSATAKMGEWFVEESFGRLLNNYLSVDQLRNQEHILGMTGSALLWAKNHQTAFELGWSPFHALFETADAWASDISRGVSRTWNQGVVQGDGKEFLAGLRELARVPGAPVTASRLGGDVIRYVSNPQQFLATARGADFSRQFPDADRLISDLFLGGGKLSMNEDYALKTLDTFKQNVADKNWTGAAVRLPFALNQAWSNVLFKTYIPRIKIGVFLKEYSAALAQEANRPGGGAVDRALLSRQVWDRVENRFGEMNWDNLFWDRTMKSGLQLAFRSVTWWLGNVRAAAQGVAGQTREVRQWIETGRSAGQRLPYLDPGFVWATVAIGMTSATLSNIIQIASGQGPTKNMTDVIYPRIGGVDDRGHPLRANIITYLRTYASLAKDPLASVHNALSSLYLHLGDVMENRDFFGNFVSDPDAPAWERWLDNTLHMVGSPFAYTAAQRASQQGATVPQAIELFFLTKAPGDVDFTPAEQEMAKRIRNRGFRLTPKEMERAQKARSLERGLRRGTPGAEEQASQAVEQGDISARQYQNVERIGGTPTQELRSSYMRAGFKRLSLEDAVAVYEKASPEEKEFLRDEMESKEKLIDRLPAESRDRLRRRYFAALGVPAGVQ